MPAGLSSSGALLAVRHSAPTVLEAARTMELAAISSSPACSAKTIATATDPMTTPDSTPRGEARNERICSLLSTLPPLVAISAARSQAPSGASVASATILKSKS